MSYEPAEDEQDIASFGVRVESFAADGVYVGPNDFPGAGGDVTERSLIAVADDGHISAAVPLVDVLKYVLKHEPHLLDRARAELDA